MKDIRAGKDNDATWGRRQRGTGPVAWAIGRRFEMACRKNGLNRERMRMRTDLFTAPKPVGAQLDLF